ncbi:MAG: aminotransferase class V-fold PLP-dependent enzyme [Deltaproteobacteria bacterium]|jgi:aromatic-L-amino-acid decarboxylase|nr:aminotransferase class V-fold PLP-dependent enzyme [Deltaproteobacteria bacterium]
MANSASGLDPEDPAALLAVAQAALSDNFTDQTKLRAEPVFRPLPRRVRDALQELPRGSAEEVYQRFQALVRPYSTGNRHPRFFAWAMGAGTPWSMITGILSGAMEVNAVGGAQASTLVEEVVLGRFREWLGFPKEATGLFTSGASLANLLGLAVARHRGAAQVRQIGLFGAAPLRVYASHDVHLGLEKAVELLGLGRANLVRIETDPTRRISLEALRAAIRVDRTEGRVPLAIVGTAGTVQTGAIDDLAGLATIAESEDLWLHVDGAYGVLARLSPRLSPRLAGLERAHSVAFDLHKWLHAPMGTGALMVRDPRAHRLAFSGRADYQGGGEGGFAASRRWYQELGLELSRPFLALGPWLTLQAYGEPHLARVIEAHVDQAQALAERISAAPELELWSPPSLHVVLFRHRASGALPSDRLQARIAATLHGRGRFALGTVTIDSQVYLRAAVGNHRTRSRDLEALVQAVVTTGHALQRES